MIYKIVGKFFDIDFDKALEKLGKNFVFIFLDKTLYVAVKKYDPDFSSESALDKIFRPTSKFYIEQITEKNLKFQSEFVRDWCESNFVALEKQRYEIEQQEKLRLVWAAMDDMERDLQQKAVEKMMKGGVDSG